MKVIILAGGLGSRISEETEDKPKPMVLIDDKPILWHVMNIYAKQGFTDFIIATGYKNEVIDKWVKGKLDSSWNVKAQFTGLTTQTAGRIKQCFSILKDSRVMVTYGDGLGNVNLKNLIMQHEDKDRLATVTAVRPPARFGVLESEEGIVTHFGEKNQTDAGWINGGFFVLERAILDFIDTDVQTFEGNIMPTIVNNRQLASYHHHGFWQPMDTLREKHELSRLAEDSNPPWLSF